MGTEKTINSAEGQAVNVDQLVSGDSVHFTKVVSNGHSMKFTTVYGKIVSISGNVATVKMRNGRECWANIGELRKEGQRTQLTDAFLGR